MNSRLHCRVCILAALVSLSAFSAPKALGQSFYTVDKTQNYTQTSAAGSVADPFEPYRFRVESATNATLTLPAGATQALQFVGAGRESPYRFTQIFATKAALDGAFPNGTYRLTGTGIPTLSFNLTTDNYPAATPQVTGGTWNAGGLLVLVPGQSNTINFSTNSSYASAGVAGHMAFFVSGVFDNVNLENEIVTVPAGGLPVTTTPITSFTIPANQLTNGRVYEAELDFDTVTTLDLTSVSGGAAVATFSRQLKFYIAAVAGGTTPSIPATPSLANQTGVAGGSATFNVTGTGSNVFTIWRFNGQQIDFGGSTKYTFNGSGLTINNLTAADAGNYTVTLITAGGIVTSNAASLTLSTPAAVAITRQPAAQTVANNSTVVFSVAATGNPAPTYQWRRDGNNIQGATTATLVLSGNTGPNAALPGNYTVALTGAPGTATVVSSPASLSLVSTTDPGRLINLSILTALNAGETLTMGTALGGVGTSGNKPLLARAGGPALSQLGVSAFLPDPTMTLNFTGSNPATVVATNNDWAGDATLSAAFTAVGAFGYASANSKDAAIFRSGGNALQAGNYTVQVSDTSSTASGTVIAELYDATPTGSFNAATPRLINVSVLKTISATGSLTAGFFVGGSTAKTVLIRAIGPGLSAVGVTSGTMADPQLTLFNSSQAQIAANNDWGGDPQLTSTANRVGAFAVTNGASKDAMLLVTLTQGASYTVQMNPVSGTAGGLAIIEVYEVP